MRAVSYKKMLVNEQASSPVLCGNENLEESEEDKKRETNLISTERDKRFD